MCLQQSGSPLEISFICSTNFFFEQPPHVSHMFWVLGYVQQ